MTRKSILILAVLFIAIFVVSSNSASPSPAGNKLQRFFIHKRQEPKGKEDSAKQPKEEDAKQPKGKEDGAKQPKEEDGAKANVDPEPKQPDDPPKKPEDTKQPSG